MKILVTGAAGFMGSYVVDTLIARGGHEVYGVDDLSGGYESNVNPASHFTKLDLRQKKEVEQYIANVRPELVYHLAADATEGRSQFTPISATERNYLAYLYTLVPSIKYGLKKVVVTSSMSIYGAQKSPFTEDMKPMAEDIYAIAKAAMEESTKILAKVHGFNYVVVRPHNVYGPRQNLSDPYRNVIGIFINCLMNNKNFYIYGDGNQKRAFTYIDDFNPYFVETGFSDKVNGEIINIGPTQEYTINELAEVVLQTFFPDGNIPIALKPKYLPLRPQEVMEAYCSNDKAVAMLGYKTSISLKDGVAKMVTWAKTMGPQPFHYLEEGLELETSEVPATWKNKLL